VVQTRRPPQVPSRQDPFEEALARNPWGLPAGPRHSGGRHRRSSLPQAGTAPIPGLDPVLPPSTSSASQPAPSAARPQSDRTEGRHQSVRPEGGHQSARMEGRHQSVRTEERHQQSYTEGRHQSVRTEGRHQPDLPAPPQPGSGAQFPEYAAWFSDLFKSVNDLFQRLVSRLDRVLEVFMSVVGLSNYVERSVTPHPLRGASCLAK
jgi:hypothetical protein